MDSLNLRIDTYDFNLVFIRASQLYQYNGNSEDNIQINMTQTHFKTYAEADMAFDQRNNAIGRELAADSTAVSKLDLTKEAVEQFREEGFWIDYKADNGYELRQVKLSHNRYEGYKKGLENKDENAKWIQTDK
jgi:biotin operon repressor